MINKVGNNSPAFNARFKVKRGVPGDIGQLLKTNKNILPDEYIIVVKQNWKINVNREIYSKNEIPFEFEKAVKGNLEVILQKGKRFKKKENLDSKQFNWFKDKKNDENSFINCATNILDYVKAFKVKNNI